MTMVTGFSPLPLAAPNLSSPALARARFRLSASLFLPLHISSNQGFRRPCPKLEPKRRLHRFTMAAAIVSSATEELPSILDSTSEPPSLFDGTARLYISYSYPYAQRIWIARNYKGLQEKIKLVAICRTGRCGTKRRRFILKIRFLVWSITMKSGGRVWFWLSTLKRIFKGLH